MRVECGSIRAATFSSSLFPIPALPSGVDVQCCAVILRHPGSADPCCAVVGVYATCAGETSLTETYARALCTYLQSVVSSIRQFHGDLPVCVAGDFNARCTAFSDTVTTPRGRVLHQFCLDEGFQAVGAPSYLPESERGKATPQPTSALDLVLAPAALPVSSPATRLMAGTDHMAVLVEIDVESTFFYRWHLDMSSLDEDTFVHSLDRSLNCHSGTPHGQDYRIQEALKQAIEVAGGNWVRRRIFDHPRPPTVNQIISTALSSPWQAVGMLRRPATSEVIKVSKAAMLRAFGARGMQRDHTNDAALVRAPPDSFTPVSIDEVREAIFSHRIDAAPDTDGVSVKLLRLASRSACFISALTSLITDCLRRGVVPSRWNSLTVVPIPKPGLPAHEVANLRPIYLVDTIAKTADRVMENRGKHFFRPHPRQFGFRRGVLLDVLPLALLERCVEAQSRRNGSLNTGSSRMRQPMLTEFFGGVAPSPTSSAPGVSTRLYALFVAVDIKNAFPGAPARGIVDGYRQCNMPCDYIQYKIATLTGRRIRVLYRGGYSAWENVRDGTNQGSITGTMDFSAFSSSLLYRLDEWQREARSTTREFGMVADDLSLVVSGEKDHLVPAAVQALKVIQRWADEFQITLSQKSTALWISPQGCSRDTRSQSTLRCGNLEIPILHEGSIKVLGYRIDAQLTMSDAVAHVRNCHDRALHCLRPCMAVMSLQDRRAVYDALALSHLRRLAPILLALGHDRASPVWATLDSMIADGARLITGTVATANTVSIILEAGLLDAYAFAVREACRLRAKIGAADICPAMRELAQRFLARHQDVSQCCAVTTGVVTDCPRVNVTQWSSNAVYIRPTPHNTQAEMRELLMLRAGVDSGDYGAMAEMTRLKQTANRRLRVRLALLRGMGSFVAFTDGSVRNPIPGSRSSGAAGASTLYDADGRLISYTFERIGTVACSFTAEVAGLESLIRLIVAALNSGDLPHGAMVTIVSDSQSALAALELGPVRQRDGRLDRIWHGFVDLARRFGLRFALFFAYSHCGWREMDHVDEIARSAAKHGADVCPPPWWKDAARAACEDPIHEHLTKRIVEKATLRSKAPPRNSPGARPSRWPARSFRTFSQREIVRLCQLRTNACPALGGHLVDRIHPCPRCGIGTARGRRGTRSMVEHLFVCTATAQRRRTFGVRNLGDLWTRPRNCLDYVAEAFIDWRPPQAPP